MVPVQAFRGPVVADTQMSSAGAAERSQETLYGKYRKIFRHLIKTHFNFQFISWYSFIKMRLEFLFLIHFHRHFNSYNAKLDM